HQDTLEIIYNFDLPKGAIVHDSWLWFNDEIIKGKIMDRWTASQIYEEIVNRRRDPSVLYKNYDNYYELRIFPMAGDESRKVKITFLLPAIWSAANVSTTLPLYLFNNSANPLKILDVITQLTSEWKNPKIAELPNKIFEAKTYPIVGECLQLTLDQNEIYSNSLLNFQVDAPFNNGVYLNTFEGKEDNIFQLAYLPSVPENVTQSKKTAILIDYELSKSNVSAKDVINNVKKMLLEHFSARDSFNLIFSNTTIKRISEKWLSADSNSVNNIFENLPANIISNYSNLPSLLANGIEFISNNGNDGKIVLLANSDGVGEYKTANALIDDLINMMTETIPINIGDYIQDNYRWYYYGNRDYKGNAYFYENIAKLTGGNTFYVDYNIPFITMISDLFASLGSLLSTYDLHTTMTDGFCYGRFDMNSNENSISVNTPILQVGKYFGSFPFKAEFNGMIEGKPFSDIKEINTENLFHADSISDVIWSGKYINTIDDESDYYYYSNLTNQEIYDLIDISIEKRILTKYTAFLCLEPGFNLDIL
ncbi:MAG: hypothetical protein KDC52_14490, partial [Ignavibacteriae bacterium]|nr:hypothetical protein [Ignavibacteriota bacterium]